MHEQIEDLLPYYVKGTLSDEERDLVEVHLAGCDSCRAELEVWRQIAESIQERGQNQAFSLPPLEVLEQPEIPVISLNHRLQAHEKEIEPMTIHLPALNQRQSQATPRRFAGITLAVAILITALWGVLIVLNGVGADRDPQGLTAIQTEDIPETVYDYLASDERFSLLVEQIDLSFYLSTVVLGEDDITMFALTNDVLEPLLDALEPDSAFTMEEQIESVILAHMMNGRWTIADFPNAPQGELRGSFEFGDFSYTNGIMLTQNNDNIWFINDQARIVEADIITGNGIVHVLDNHVIPAFMLRSDDDPFVSLAEMIARDERLTVFSAIIDRSLFLQDIFNSNATFATVFVPTDEFLLPMLGIASVDELDTLDPEQLEVLVLLHTAEGLWSLELINEAETIHGEWNTPYGTTYGTTMQIHTYPDNSIWVNETAPIITSDIITSTGIVHIVSAPIIDETWFEQFITE